MFSDIDLKKAGASLKLLFAFAAVVFFAAGCAVPLGMYSHNPNELWQAEFTNPGAAPDGSLYKGSPIVIKRFENNYKVPVGANFVTKKAGKTIEAVPTAKLPAESMSQAYTPSVDFALPIYEATYHRLRKSGYSVWKDYLATTKATKPPNCKGDYIIIKGVINYLELATFSSQDVKESVKVKVLFTALSSKGEKKKEWEVEKLAKITRGNGDILAVVGEKIADELAATINNGGLL